MGFIQRLGTVMRVMKRAKRQPQSYALLRRRPAILIAQSVFEMSLLASGLVDSRLKALARVKTSALVGCPF
jgi:hypothetical protein